MLLNTDDTHNLENQGNEVINDFSLEQFPLRNQELLPGLLMWQKTKDCNDLFSDPLLDPGDCLDWKFSCWQLQCHRCRLLGSELLIGQLFKLKQFFTVDSSLYCVHCMIL